MPRAAPVITATRPSSSGREDRPEEIPGDGDEETDISSSLVEKNGYCIN
jgi:hypothetical protein